VYTFTKVSVHYDDRMKFGVKNEEKIKAVDERM